MKPLSGKELAKLLEKWLAAVARPGKSPYLREAKSIVRLSVPIHGNKPLKRGLLHHLLKMTEIDSQGGQQ